MAARKLRSRRRLFSRLGFEALEDRALLAGNVMAQIRGGALTMTGDNLGNQVLVEQVSANTFRLTPLDATTTINRMAGPVTLSGFRSGVSLAAGGGDDLFRFDGTARAIALGKSVSLNLGAGNDRLEMIRTNASRALVINAADGNDTVDQRNNQVYVGVLIGGRGFDTLNSVGNSFRHGPVVVQFEQRTQVSSPTAINDSATVAEGGTVTIDLAANDQQSSAALDLDSIVITDQPNSGSVTVNADGTVTYTHNGSDATSDTFRYTIADTNGQVSSEAQVSITITPVNDAPTIGAVADVTTNVGVATGPLGVTLADDITAAGSLTLTGASSNTTLVPNASIYFGGSGAARTVIVTPAAGQTGTATITLTVTDDGGLTSSETFVVTVNAAPTVSDVANVTIDEDAQAGPFNVTVGDDLTAAGSLTVTASSSNTALVPNANIALGGSGSTRTVLVTPAANATGTATITLTVTDAGGLTATDTFTVTVNPVNDPPVGTLDLLSVQENSGLVVSANVLTNDTNGGDGASLTVTALSSGSVGAPVVGAFGTFQVNADGSFTYDLDDTIAAVDQLLAGEELFDELTYTLSDGTATATALLRIRVQGAAE